MDLVDTSRRSFLQSGASLAGSSLLRFSFPGLAALAQVAAAQAATGSEFSILGAEEAAEFEAIAARILPKTDTPGAREAGVIHFFDQSFGTFNADKLGFARGGLKQFLAGVPGGQVFSALSEADQDAYLTTQQDTPFFGLMRFMTLCGFFGMAKYGGNRDDIGWKLLGLEPHAHAYTSPFGYYDAEYMKEHPDA